MISRTTTSTLFPYTTLFRSIVGAVVYFVAFVPETKPQVANLTTKPTTTTVPTSAPVVEAPPKTYGELRSEEHTSELQSHVNLVCRLLLEKKKQRQNKWRNVT